MTDSTAPEKVIINGQEIDPGEAAQLIELGSKYRKIESDLNTSLDKVYPDYTRLTQEKKTWEQKEAELRGKLSEFEAQQTKAQKAAETPSDVKQIREAARQVGLLDEEALNEKGYIRKEDLDKYLDERQNLQKAAEQVLNQAEILETKIDGSDGRVPFNKDAVMAYAYVNNIGDLEEAYDKMNEKFNAKWKQDQIEGAEKPGLTTLSAGGKKEPSRPKYNNNNLGAAIGEWLNGLE